MGIIISNDLCIREVKISDTASIYNLIDKNRVYLEKWLDWVKYTKSVEDRLEYIEEVIAERENNKADNFVIIYKNEIVGIVGYVMKNEYTAYIGYWIGESFQGNGIVTKSCKKVIEFLFQEKRIHRAEIRVAENNKKSQKLPKRLNFKFEGMLRDVDYRNGKFESESVYSLLETEFE